MWIRQVDAYPDVDTRSITIRIAVGNQTGEIAFGELDVSVTCLMALKTTAPEVSDTNRKSRGMVLNSAFIIPLPASCFGVRSIVQAIDNIDRCPKLGMIFEARVGAGKLIICSSALISQMEYTEIMRLYRSLVRYVISSEFEPEE